MKLDKDPAKVTSDGKLLEVMPWIMGPHGEPYMLPPVVYAVPNWLLGFTDDHYIGSPINLYIPYRMDIPGSNSSASHRLSFQVRVLEQWEGAGVETATVDVEAVTALIEAIKAAQQ